MRWIITWILIVFPVIGVAQQAAVQTGEHGSFTRVVVTMPSSTQWRLGRNDNGYLLRLADIEGYDLRRFFDLIPRDRILEAFEGPEAGELQLKVDCSCYADAFLESGNFLVIDIRDGAAPQNAVFEAPIDLELPQPVETIETIVTQPYAPPVNRLLPLVLPEHSDSEPSEIATPSQKTVIAETTVVPDEIETATTNLSGQGDDLLALEQAITESLSRGLSQGMLEAERDPHDNGANQMPLGDSIPPGLQARTGIDFSALPQDPQIDVNQEGRLCLPDRYFDVASWGGEGTFSEQMGEARANLTGEFDRLDEEAVMAKARLFVFFGFGREAIQTLRLDGVSSQERQYLTSIAQIIDGDPVVTNLFEGQVSCQSSVALWAMLVNGPGGLDGKVDPASVLRAFKKLPIGLQSHLGPPLSERFLAIGDEDSALRALAVATSAPAPTVDAQLVETALMQELGETENALENLTELARTEAGTTAETMIAFLDAVAAGSISAQESDFDLAHVLRFENARRTEGAELGKAIMRAYVAQEEFGPARDLLNELSGEIENDDLTGLINTFATSATERLPDAEFLDVAFDMAVWPTAESAQDAMARRLLTLGFPEQGALLIEGGSGGTLSAERAALRAEIALMLGDAETALTYMDVAAIGAEDALRLAALDLLSGNTSIPNLRYDNTGPQRLWRRGAWGELSEGDDELLREASVAILEENVATLAPEAPLESSRMLLGQSAQSRAVVDDLLDRFTAPVDF